MRLHMQKTRHGYTLIEVLFIIVIIGIITVLVISAYQQRASNVKVNKAALQIQQLLQAAMVYHNDTQCWPGNVNSSCVPFPPPDFDQYYAPINGIINPWGSKYLYQLDNNQNFTVLAQNVPTKAANKLFSLLPGASKNCGSTSCSVGTSLTSTKEIALVGVGYVTGLSDDDKSQTASYSCPAGLKKASILVGFSAIKAAGYSNQCSRVANKIINKLEAQDISCQTSPPYYCTFKMQAEAVMAYKFPLCDLYFETKNYGTMDAVYLFYCHN